MHAKFTRRQLGLATVCVVIGAQASGSSATDLPVVNAGTLSLPVLNPILMNIIKERGFDTKNEFALKMTPYSSISGMYAGLATGEVDTIMGGPTVIQKLSLDGVPLRIVATGLRPSDLMILTRTSSFRSVSDLRGKELAADMGTQQYQMVSMCAKHQGLSLGAEVTVVNANFALARSMLESDRVDAAMVIEPLATIMLSKDSSLHIIFDGKQAWKQMTGFDGWELVCVMRADAVSRVPNSPKRLMGALQDAANFVRNDVDAADAIASKTTGLPPGVLKAAVRANRWELDVRPAWGPERTVIWDMFERAVQSGFLPKIPDPQIIYTP
ncbi:ABC transporter substrate-binding protein [Mesorhizobium captivum]|uniref:ABC transporter substrate-binding protein n=1 Tax=Mesorhizobium captivum TaxID=3072319 RepID=UPI002A246D15|nr:ABC transporter substrate-binding protein [Mesorhizobium sp. VK3C]MDX8450479.1 ABC transporter substrate-binding protein [Mesorhizobium sp. VK3C]